jgi:hypothetical protein
MFVKDIVKTIASGDSRDIVEYINNVGVSKGHLFERVFDLMQRLGCVKTLTGFQSVYGSFGGKTCTPYVMTLRELMNKKVNNGSQQGGIDLLLKNDETMTVIALSFKFFEKCEAKDVSKYDVSKMMTCAKAVENLYRGYKIEFGIVTNCDLDSLQGKLQRCRSDEANHIKHKFTSDVLRVPFYNLATLAKRVHEHGNMMTALEKITKDEQNKLSLRYHQQYLAKKIDTIFMKSNVALLGALPRIGKTFVCGQVMLKYNNILYTSDVVSNLKEGVSEFIKQHNQFNSYDQHIYEELCNVKCSGKRNIVVTSNQALKSLKNDIGVKFDLIICDEAHIGGTSTKFKELIKRVSKRSTKIMYVTATFKKPQMEYEIPDNCCAMMGVREVSDLMNKEQRKCSKVLNDVEDVLGRQIEESEFDELKYPRINYCSLNLDDVFINGVKDVLDNNDSVTFFRNCFKVSNCQFTCQGKTQICNVFDKIFKKQCDMVHGKEELAKITNRLLDGKHPRMLLCYLPAGHSEMKTEDVLPLTAKLFKERYDSDLYKTLCVYSGENSKDVKKLVEQTVKCNPDKTVIVFVHKMLQTAITFESCDGIIMMDDSRSEDQLFQRMYRCATYIQGKDNVFVLDVNPDRCIHALLSYGYEDGHIQTVEGAVHFLRLIENLISFKTSDLSSRYDDAYYMDIVDGYFRKQSSNNHLKMLIESTIFDDEKLRMIIGAIGQLTVTDTLAKVELNNKKCANEVVGKKQTLHDMEQQIDWETKKKLYREMIKKMTYV